MVIQKIKEWSPVAVLALLIILIGYWAVNVSLTQQVITNQTLKNSQDIQQVVTFLTQVQKSAQPTNQTK